MENTKTKIVSVANQKGGVAKTTSAFNIAAILAQREKRVLMIDLDPQSSLSVSCMKYEYDRHAKREKRTAHSGPSVSIRKSKSA